jgi:hypothetical protein
MVGGSPRVLSFFHHLTGRHDIAEILLKVALNTKHQIKSLLPLISNKLGSTLEKQESKFFFFREKFIDGMPQQRMSVSHLQI